MEQLVSIIIPAYNAERWIADTIGSAMSQTWSKKEIIVIDDGSTDHTFSIANGFASGGVEIVRQQNKGVSAARNKGFSLAQGTYIQWLDADDLLVPNKITNQMKFAEAGKDGRTLLTSSFGTFYFCPERAKLTPTALWQDLSPVDWLVTKFNNNTWLNPATWLISRKLTELAGPWNEQLVRDNDGEYICRVVAASEQVRFVGEAMSYYRICSMTSLSHSLSQKARECLVQSIILCTEYLLSLEDSERTRSACVKYLQSPVPYLYPQNKELLCKLRSRAAQLGGQVVVPELRKKYALLNKLFGYNIALKAMIILPRLKRMALARFDKSLHYVLHKQRNLS